MKKSYYSPRISITYIDSKDIITVSGGNELPDQDPEELNYTPRNTFFA